MSWNQEQCSHLIDLYRNHECLYNTKHQHYFKRDKRADAIHEITVDLQVIRPNTTESEVKAKLNSLKTQFNREINKIRNKQSGAGVETVEVTLWCFEQLLFLLDHTEERASFSNVPRAQSEVEDSQREEQNKENDHNEEFSQPPGPSENILLDSSEPVRTIKRKKISASSASGSTQEFLQEVTKQISKLSEVSDVPEDHWDTFGKYISSEIKRLKSEKTKKNVQRRILHIIQVAEDEED